MSLRREIENFVRNGKLIRFLAQERIWEVNQQGCLEGGLKGLRHAKPRRRDQARREGLYDREKVQMNAREVQRPLQNQKVVRKIHTVSGGIVGGGESNSARKAYARSMQGQEVYSLHKPMKAAKTELVVLSFSEEDARGL
jgi:hypothetical protein